MQLSYSINQQEGILGGLYSDTEPRDVISANCTEPIPFGRGVCKVIGQDDQCRLLSANQGSLNFVGDLVTSNVVNLKVNGSTISAVTFATDHATTMGLIAVQIALKTTYVSSATVGTARQIVVKGIDATDVLITDIVVTAGASQTTGTFTQGTRDALLGASLRLMTIEANLPNDDTTTPQYPIYDTVNILRNGKMYVYFETAFNRDTDTLYCRFLANGSGKEVGQFRNDSDSGKAVAITNGFQVFSTLSTAGIGVVEINNPSK